MFKFICGLIALVAASACTTTQALVPSIQTIDRPPLNASAQAELGDTIVEKGRLTTYDGLRLKNELTWGDGFFLKKFTMSPGRLRATQQDKEYTYYSSENMTAYDALLGTYPYNAGGLCIKKADPNYVRAFISLGNCGMNMTPQPNIEHIRVTDLNGTNFRQELIYNGRSGSTVKFLYREFSGDIARPPFSQDVQYDLGDGNVIGFKGVRVEILEAKNTSLTYRVLSSFPDAPG